MIIHNFFKCETEIVSSVLDNRINVYFDYTFFFFVCQFEIQIGKIRIGYMQRLNSVIRKYNTYMHRRTGQVSLKGDEVSCQKLFWPNNLPFCPEMAICKILGGGERGCPSPMPRTLMRISVVRYYMNVIRYI